jgi:hypothetical protein
MAILHCVFCNFHGDASEADRRAVLEGLQALALSLPGVLAFYHGPNRDFEDKSADYDAGFVIRFADKAALELYAENQEHKALGGKLCDLCDGGADGIIVYDLEV